MLPLIKNTALENSHSSKLKRWNQSRSTPYHELYNYYFENLDEIIIST